MLTLLPRVEPQVDLTQTIFHESGALAVFVFGAVVLATCGWLAAEALGWYRIPTVLAAVGLMGGVFAALFVTGVPVPVGHIDPVAVCVRDGFTARGGMRLPDFVLLMPFAFFATVATRRPITVVLVSAFVSAAVELTGALTGIAACQQADTMNNCLGAVTAAVAAWLVLTLVDTTVGPVHAAGYAVRPPSGSPGTIRTGNG